MARARKRRFYPKKKAPFWGRFLRRRLGIEQICDHCSRPYLSKPPAKPIEQLVHGSAVACVFVDHQFGKKRFHVQFGRNAAIGQEIIISQFLGVEQLEDIAGAASKAGYFISEQRNLRLVKPPRQEQRRKQTSRR